MRHRVVKKRLGRDLDHRKALERNLSLALLDKEKIETTLAKAKWVRPYVEKLITKAIKAAKSENKVAKFNAIKEIKKDINSDEMIKKLVENLAVKYIKFSGGYTRIIKTRNRDGDNAVMARIELVQVAEPVKEKKENKDGK